MIISFEGVDGSGKSTQIESLKKYFTDLGKPFRVFREPGGTDLGERVRSVLLDKEVQMGAMSELLLFYAARAQLLEQEILPALDSGVIVILDRFFDSTFAYQGYGRQVFSVEMLQQLNEMVTQGLKPDVTFYMRIEVADAFKRRSGTELDRMEINGKSFFDRVSEGYDKLAEAEHRFVVIDAMQSADKISAQIVQVVEKI